MRRVMKLVAKCCVLLLLIGLSMPASAGEKGTRTFMFIGEPSPKAWEFMVANPEDRKKAVASGMEALGGRVVGYYFGLGNGRNYIIAELPDDNELIQAVYVMRMPSGLLNSYEVVELMPSDQMSEALKRSKKLIEQDTTAK